MNNIFEVADHRSAEEKSEGVRRLNSSWKVSPSEYAQGRAPSHEVPDAPLSVYVPMRDGVKLAVDVHLPSLAGKPAAGKFPCILIFTPYYRRFALAEDSRAEASPNTARYRDLFTPHGYAVIVVDIRGTGASFGCRESFRSPIERDDAFEIADWVCESDFCDGRLGVTGISYLGASSDFLASTGHPAVKAIAPLFSVWDTYENNYFPGGVQLPALIESYSRLMKGLDLGDRDALAPFDVYAHEDFRGPAPVDDDADGQLRDAAMVEHRNSYRHADLMREFVFREKALPYDPGLSSASLSPYYFSNGTREDVAIYSVSGWLDGAGYANGALTRFLTKQRNPHHLLLGPWDHGARSDVSPWRTTDDADDFWWADILRFFDHYLRGMDTGLEQERPIHFYTLHEEQWHSASRWEENEQGLDFRLSPSGTLVPTNSAVTEDDGSTPQTTVLTYQSDFSIGTGSSSRFERIAGQHVAAYYNDWQGRTGLHLYFDSPRLEDGFALTGHACLTLDIAANQPDATVFAYITELEASGSERYVTEGLLRLIHRHESLAPPEIRTTWPYRSYREQDAAPLQPGEFENIRIPLLPVSWRFSAGSRIRLSIAGADADHATPLPHGRPPMLSIRTNPVTAVSSLSLPSVTTDDESR